MSDVEEERSSLAVVRVRALMERHGMPKYRQSAWLADATGLSYAQAHRRMNGTAAWTLEDLQKVAAIFGESLADVVSDARPGAATAAVLCVGAARMACTIWIGKSLSDPPLTSVVAIRRSDGWEVASAADAGGAPCHSIERIEATPNAAPRRMVAVLDDDRDLTDSICAHLQGSGYDARSYYRTGELQATLESAHHDAFVIDWIVGGSSTAGLIASIRAKDALCPIVVLTAQVESGVVKESEIAEAVADHNVVFSEKPVRMAILTASLTRAFAARQP